MTLVAGNTYTLNGRVQIGNGSEKLDAFGFTQGGVALTTPTLTIEAGVNVKGLAAETCVNLNAAVLQINRGAKIEAVGTPTAPITFSSEDADEVGAGEWGGLVINGFGSNNSCSDSNYGLCNLFDNYTSGYFGQIDSENLNDDSGTLKYVRITEGGEPWTCDGEEVNGLRLNAVGKGTSIEHLQLHDNAGVGVAFFGGDVNVKYAVVTAAGDDSVDFS